MLRLAAGMLMPDSVKNAAESAKSTVNYVAKTVQDGTEYVVSSASSAAATAVNYFAEPSVRDRLAKKYEDQKIGDAAKNKVELTPEQRWQHLQLHDCKTRISQHVALLRNEVLELRAACLPMFNGKEIALKQTKERQLENLLNAPDWDSFKMQAQTLLDVKNDTIKGKHSRTKVILDDIVKMQFSAAVEDEVINVDQPLARNT